MAASLSELDANGLLNISTHTSRGFCTHGMLTKLSASVVCNFFAGYLITIQTIYTIFSE